MKALLVCAALAALAGASVATAQTPDPGAGKAPPPATSNPATTQAPAKSPPAADASSTTGFRTGLAVKDAQGASIGTIARVIKTPDGATTYSVTVDGKNVNVPGSALTLSPTGDSAISSMSKAQITASTNPST